MKFGPEWIGYGIVAVLLFGGAAWAVIRGKKKAA